jgi:hypothetical protein
MKTLNLTQDEKNARAVLETLGYWTITEPLRSREGYIYEIWDVKTSQLRWASVHSDLFVSIAITETLKYLSHKESLL